MIGIESQIASENWCRLFADYLDAKSKLVMPAAMTDDEAYSLADEGEMLVKDLLLLPAPAKWVFLEKFALLRGLLTSSDVRLSSDRRELVALGAMEADALRLVDDPAFGAEKARTASGAVVIAADPVVEWIDRHRVINEACPGEYDREAEAGWIAQIHAYEATAGDVRPTTAKGAAEAIRYVTALQRECVADEWHRVLLTNVADFLTREGSGGECDD